MAVFSTQRFGLIIMGLLLSFFLSACGGGDSNSPTASIPPPDDSGTASIKWLTGGKITIAGSAKPGSSVKITFNDGSTVTAITSAAGKYTATSPKPIVDNNGNIGKSIRIEAIKADQNETRTTTITVPEPKTRQARLVANLAPVVSDPGKLAGVKYRSSFYNGTGTSDKNGEIHYKEGETVTVSIAGKDYLISPKPVVDLSEVIGTNPDTQQNFKTLLISLDKDHNASNGIDLNGVTATIDPSHSTREVNKRLYKATGEMPVLLFKPSLGINTEAPQGGVDTVGQAMPFVDIFRTARPFAELSSTKTQYDANGWPTKLDPDIGYARTKVLQGTLSGAIPNGKYTLVYEGEGKLELGGQAIANVTGLSDRKGFTFDFILKDEANPEANALSIIIRDISPDNYIKNIRIVMPGGTCQTNQGEYNPFIHVNSQSECPENTTYRSFAGRLGQNRNDIIFNPDYLMFLRNFKVIRMMNLMEASHGTHNCLVPLENGEGSKLDEACLTQPLEWSERAKLDDAVWGGNDGRTPYTKRNGVPVEVIVSLANTVNRDIWVNMPHAATDEYISEFANYTAEHLKDNLKTYIEYANETWNNGFLAHHYVEKLGFDNNLDKNIPARFSNSNSRDGEYFARLRYYSQHSVEIFKLWKAAFHDNNDRLIRVLGTSQGDTILTEEMIKHVGQDEVDAIAMAPYFFGCISHPLDRRDPCPDAKVLLEATTVDDLFEIIDQDKSIDPSALSSTLNKIAVQAKMASKYNLKLLSYEGGQHLTIMGDMGNLDEANKQRLRLLFKKANRDPRMKQRYETLLNGWKDLSDEGTTLFTLYTLPQSFYRFGNWGIKEHLNKSRKESPKYDGVMTFQERVGKCWWDGCE